MRTSGASVLELPVVECFSSVNARPPGHHNRRTMKYLFTAILLVLGLALAPATALTTGRTTVVVLATP